MPSASEKQQPSPAESKAPLLPCTQPPDHVNAVPADATMLRPQSKRRFHAALFVLVVGLFWLARTWSCGHEHEHTHREPDARVPLEVHIMSKCPDARACLQKLVLPTMANVSDEVDFRLSFIGKLTDEDDGVQCMHGQTECLGNMVLLCAASEYPDPKLYLGFTNCLINDYREIPRQGLIEDCALEHGLDFGVLNDCMSRDTGAYGMGLLRDSVQHSADAGVTTSCTVRLNNKVRCVHDGGKWKDCDDGSDPEDLIRDIHQLYKEAHGWSY